MNLPIQSEPIRRAVTTANWQDAGGINPQMDCVCYDDGTGSRWWCIVGRDLWDTAVDCT